MMIACWRVRSRFSFHFAAWRMQELRRVAGEEFVVDGHPEDLLEVPAQVLESRPRKARSWLWRRESPAGSPW